MSKEMLPIKERPFKRIKKLCLFSVIFLGLGLVVWGLSGAFGRFFRPNRTDGGPGGATPALQYNATVYSRHSGDAILRLPGGFLKVGELQGQEAVEHLRDFTSTFGGIGSALFADPSNPHSVYLKNQDAYLLFVDSFLHSELIMYQNMLYQNTAGAGNWFYTDTPWSEADGYQPVGAVGLVVYDAVPAQNGQSNIEGSHGGEIYGSKTDGDVIYVKVPDSGHSCKYIRLTRMED